jgi:hypothetical protein
VRFVRLSILLLVAATCQACLVVTLHPVYDPDSIAFEPALVGTWLSDEDNVSVTFERAEWHSYHLMLDDGGKITRLSARLTRLGDNLLLLDLTPLDGTDIPPLQLSVHAVFRLTMAEDALSIASLDYDHFYGMAKAGTLAGGLVLDARQNAVLTAPTDDLRHWLLAHAGDEGLFAAPVSLKRKAGAAPQSQ